jgi:hypothetical protein
VFPATFKVVLDANVIYPFTLRDTLLRAAAAGLYQVYWDPWGAPSAPIGRGP